MDLLSFLVPVVRKQELMVVLVIQQMLSIPVLAPAIWSQYNLLDPNGFSIGIFAGGGGGGAGGFTLVT